MLQQMLDYCKNNNIANEEARYNYLLYLDLCEVMKYWDVTWGCEGNVFFCSARKHKEGSLLTFIPFPIKKQLTLGLIEELQTLFNTKTIILAVRNSDSTSLYYEIKEGLVEKSDEVSLPSGPTDNYIRNNKKFLFTKALNGT